MSELEKFLEERSKIRIPGGDVAWIEMLAQDLALGVMRGLWDRRVWHSDSPVPNLIKFLHSRWPTLSKLRERGRLQEVLRAFGYYEEFDSRQESRLTQAAFDLLQRLPPYNVFISYRRKDSSALALLVSHRLQHINLIPFVDMALKAGGNWHADLEERIKDCDYFIILLGKETLSSSMTVKEIKWAL